MKVELLGINDKKKLEERIKVVAAAGRLSRYNGTAFEILEKFNDYEKNLNLIKRIIGMGHESITDHDYLVFGIENVSPIVEQTIIEERFSSFTWYLVLKMLVQLLNKQLLKKDFLLLP